MQRGIGMMVRQSSSRYTTSCFDQDAYILPKNDRNLNNASKILSQLFWPIERV